MQSNTGPGVVIDAPAVAPIDWATAEKLAEQLGPRTRGLVAVRNEDGLRSWLAFAVRSSEAWSPQMAGLYRELAALVGVECERVPARGWVVPARGWAS